MMDDNLFEKTQLDVNGVTIHVLHGGSGPPLLLLHGFPQNHLIWRKVAPQLAQRYTLVMPDLRGYGDSSKPSGAPGHANFAKRVMAQDMIEVMQQLGHARFGVCGHDRGGRVAHRLAIDHPAAVEKLMLLDISPTAAMYQATDQAFATAYYHWFFLIQPSPLPETLIGSNAPWYLRTVLGGWGSNNQPFIEDEVIADYERCFTAPGALHAMCEDYRAAASIDLEHDREGGKIACPVRVLWGEHGVVARFFNPVADWQAQALLPVTGKALPAGHFIPEQVPDLLLDDMLRFFGS